MEIIGIVRTAFSVLTWLIIARVLLSWIRLNPYNPVVKFIYEFTEPILAPFRRIMPSLGGLPIDFSPILALFAIRFVEMLIIRFLVGFM
ncbi:YggT family protein [Desulfitispora alkaliphila]|uniref:YggT family protein n=1 Tax=Desulfitispora alkaliphila TaxID=622674 RepID=UPI003D1AC156